MEAGPVQCEGIGIGGALIGWLLHESKRRCFLLGQIRETLDGNTLYNTLNHDMTGHDKLRQ